MQTTLLIVLLTISSFVSAQTYQREAKAHFKLGEKYFTEGSWMKAIQQYDSCVSIQPLGFDAYYARAIAKERIGDKPGAITDYSIMIHLDPEFTESYWNRSILYYETEFYDLANADLYSLLQIPENETNAIYFITRYPDDGVSGISTLESMQSQVYNQLGLCAFKMKNYQLSVSHYTDALELEHNNPDVLVNRSLSYEAMNQFGFASNDLQLASQLDPDNTLVAYNLARIEEAQGNKSKIISTYTTIIERNPGFAEAYAKRGIAKLQAGDLQGARSDYDSAILHSPKDELMWINRGIIQHRMRNYHPAFADFTKAIELSPADEVAFFNRGNTLMSLEQFDKAINDYNSAIKYDPSNAMSYYNRGIAFHRISELDLACLDLETARKLGVEKAKITIEKMCQ